VELAEVLHPTLDGAVLVAVHVQPGSSSAGIVGVDPWRRRLQVRVTAVAKEGRANHALCVCVAGWLRLPPASVTVVEGATSRSKRLRVEGLTPESIASRLSRHAASDEA
jgi:uncharacterized protein (TIGR00251 family)